MKTGLMHSLGGLNPCAPARPKELFRARFQRALRNCVRRRFSVAECFGMIWVETSEEIALTDQEQSELYEELLAWAKNSLLGEFIHCHSPELFTASHLTARERPDPRVQAFP